MTTVLPTTQQIAETAAHAVSVALALDTVNADALAAALGLDPVSLCLDHCQIEPLARALMEHAVRSRIAADALHGAATACYEWLAAESADARVAALVVGYAVDSAERGACEWRTSLGATQSCDTTVH